MLSIVFDTINSTAFVDFVGEKRAAARSALFLTQKSQIGTLPETSKMWLRKTSTLGIFSQTVVPNRRSFIPLMVLHALFTIHRLLSYNSFVFGPNLLRKQSFRCFWSRRARFERFPKRAKCGYGRHFPSMFFTSCLRFSHKPSKTSRDRDQLWTVECLFRSKGAPIAPNLSPQSPSVSGLRASSRDHEFSENAS